MRYSLILALWSVGVLSGPCNPAQTPGAAITPGGGPDECQDETSETQPVALVESISNQDATVETSVTPDSPDNGSGQGSVSVHPTEVSQAPSGADNSEPPSPGGTDLAETDATIATTTGIAPDIIGKASSEATLAKETDAGNFNTETMSAQASDTASNGQTTEGQSNDTEGVPIATSSGDLIEDQSMTLPISTDSNGLPTGTAPAPDTMTDLKPPEQTVPVETTALISDSTLVIDTSTRGTQLSVIGTEADAPSTTHQDDTTSKPVTDDSDTSSSQTTPANDQASNTNIVTTTDAVSPSGGHDDGTPTETHGGDIPPITENPVTTTAQDAIPAPTITETPEGFAPTTVTGHPEWVSNTWITTTSGDSSDPTVVPILIGCPKCGGKGSGIVLFGFPTKVGTWFKLPGLPKFKFPCIPPLCTTPPDTSANGDDDNDDDDDEDKSSSTTCTDKVTVTDCLVACTTYTGPAGSTITPDCTTTCTKTQTGCDVVGTTTTSSAAACGPSGNSSCKSCERKLVLDTDPGEDSEQNSEQEPEDETDDDTEQLQRRGLAKRVATDTPKNIGGCTNLGEMPYFPEYPGGPLVLDNDADIIPRDSPLKNIKKWWLTTKDENCLLVLRGNLPATEYNSLRDDGDAGRPSIDHIYEKSMLLDFFREIIDSAEGAPDVKGATDNDVRQKISCNDLEAYGGTTSGSSNDLLQKVFDAFPGAKQSTSDDITAVEDPKYLDDFIGMDQWTNGLAKGLVATPKDVRDLSNKETKQNLNVIAKTPEARARKSIENKLERLEKLAIGVAMFSAPEAIDAMVRQNHRIHASFVEMDMNAKGCMDDPAVKNGVWSFAEAYKSFMAKRFDGDASWSINSAVSFGKTKLINRLTSDLNEAPKVAAADEQEWKATVDHWKLRFSKMTDPDTLWAVPVPEWTWQSVAKRDGDGLSCKRPIPTLTSSEPTTFATSTRTSSDDSTEKPTSEEIHSTTEAVTSSSSSSSEVTTSSSKKTGPTIGQRPGWLTDAPTLTDRLSPTISTPDGSSCTKTVTETMCNQGVGGGHGQGQGCVTHSRCDSWVNTKTTSKPSPSPSPTLPGPKFSENILRCNKSGQDSNPNAITYAAQSFCRDIVAKNKNNGYYWSNDRLEGKKVPSTGYHFQLDFSVRKNCLWKANYDECMRYFQLSIDSCNGSSKDKKLGGWVRDNCIEAIINPRRGG
ncbi:hypothetical protein FHETE_10675 [Fusarium heterosporum]|uniref:Uncharacterized protein n=1 Tax=Fusarium heterosporum TaxID=42747 RepID=A0A8H5SQA1_FUSHE|nr:hypothetical protein FHETE_10675 [Fusarium heterosporum]